MVTGEAGHGKDTVANYIADKLGFRTIAFADLQKQEVIDSYKNSPSSVDIVWLNIRETKENPNYRLALEHCSDVNFVSVAMQKYKEEDQLLFTNLRNREPHDFVNESLANTIRNQVTSLDLGRDGFSDAERMSLPRSPRRITQIWGTEYRRESEFGHERYWIDPVDKIVNESTEPYAVMDGRTPQEINWGKMRGLQRIEVVNSKIHKKVAAHATENIPQPCENTIVLQNESTLEILFQKVDAIIIPRLAKATHTARTRLKP